ncbi:GNAT family N-acetyltransferase [Leucobacter triazinivorans]|uniref:N-acetyltransferase family protein n=2 Tax=Microbacteriaceae TaxID=85023 RepID=A0A4P6KDZ9_9MICO|nr:N-acetyltransferase [Microbacteriaceae bacterium]QBE48482.1 N-acetyltransferase family protein [Leucobacter triazinivorans]HLR44354.1 GNAT family N-acetyltransferase [Brevibacterium sp.]
MESLQFRPMVEADWPEVENIYRAGIATGHATFETAPPNTWAAFATGKRPELSLVAVDSEGQVLGWAAASPVSARAVYAGVVEHSIYIHPDAAGHGVGSALLTAFLELADQVGVWTVQSSIFPENTASLRLHERAGFRVVGRRERIARMEAGPYAGRWRDTLLVERRTTADPAEARGEGASSTNMHPHAHSSGPSTRIFTLNRLQKS